MTGRHRGRMLLRREPWAWQLGGYMLTGGAASLLLSADPGTAYFRVLCGLLLAGLGVQLLAMRPLLAAWREAENGKRDND